LTPVADIRSGLAEVIIENVDSSGMVFHSVREKDLVGYAETRQQTLRTAMMDALRQGVWPERFRAQRGTYTAEEQAVLLESAVTVIGVGGLGGAVSLLLTRVGVGCLRLCDGDSFEESNLNRQMTSNVHRLGANKALCTGRDLGNINPAAEISTFPLWATEENLPDLIGDSKVVVDCLDNLTTRFLVEKTARAMGVPFVHGALAGQEGLVLTVFPESPGLTSMYGPLAPEKRNSAESTLGTPTVTPLVVAALQACEVINILLKRPLLAKGRLLHIDLAIPALEGLAMS
jgi:molybdopterin/thiamine biosynthesis adenylyltransferase